MLAACMEPAAPPSSPAPLSPFASDGPPPGAYAGRPACAECHAVEAKAWSGSDHDLAMQPVDSSTVLGRFQNDSLPASPRQDPGAGVRFRREGAGYIVEAQGPDGKSHPYPVRYAFGRFPLQQYLFEFPGGRLQALSAAWDTRKSAWFHLYPDSAIAPDDWLHWTRDGQNWNGMCADCHSTGLRHGYDAAAGTFKTDWKEIDVSCEACHGPGADHVAWAKAGGIKRFFMDRSLKENYGLRWDHTRAGAWGGYRGAESAVSPSGDHASGKAAGVRSAAPGRSRAARADAQAQVMACARCHGRRSALKDDFAYARAFLNEYVPQLLTEGVYHADGQLLDEAYEYGSFLQSRMYHEGVACSDCHDPHTLQLRAPGNALCTRCHEAARFDAPTHLRHAAGGPGSACVECHMPARTFMRIDARRDHSLRVPRPDLSARYGTPNACGQCHAGKGSAWAAARVAEWHGPVRKAHFSELLARGRAGGPGADSALALLVADTVWPGIARATAVTLLSAYMNGLSRASVDQGSRDADPMVRWAAAAGVEYLPEAERAPVAAPLLHDPLRAVRAAAAASLLAVAPLLPDSDQAAFRPGLAEHRAALGANAFFPGGRFNLGRYQESRGSEDSAASEYRAALAVDDRFLPARMNLAQLHARAGRSDSAEAEYREALHRFPAYAEAHYSLALLFGEAGRLDSSAAHLAAAEPGMKGNPRVSYNLGLALDKLGRYADAEKALRRALAAGAGAPDYLYVLAWFLAKRARWAEAAEFLGRLRAADPAYPGAQGLAVAVAAKRPPP